MLILARKSGERITIGDEIRVTVLDIRGKQVRLGIEAPPDTTVHREEIYLKIQSENRLAARSSASTMDALASFWRKRIQKRPEV